MAVSPVDERIDAPRQKSLDERLQKYIDEAPFDPDTEQHEILGYLARKRIKWEDRLDILAMYVNERLAPNAMSAETANAYDELVQDLDHMVKKEYLGKIMKNPERAPRLQEKYQKLLSSIREARTPKPVETYPELEEVTLQEPVPLIEEPIRLLPYIEPQVEEPQIAEERYTHPGLRFWYKGRSIRDLNEIPQPKTIFGRTVSRMKHWYLTKIRRYDDLVIQKDRAHEFMEELYGGYGSLSVKSCFESHGEYRLAFQPKHAMSPDRESIWRNWQFWRAQHAAYR
ncbi:hypothetical protein J4464_04880 [Candidatus Woesearchaeota archaeon]|nr:hypothetical protein [Candidatus Woesearchaeota archaeon]